jgi:hypothetical protein
MVHIGRSRDGRQIANMTEAELIACAAEHDKTVMDSTELDACALERPPSRPRIPGALPTGLNPYP